MFVRHDEIIVPEIYMLMMMQWMQFAAENHEPTARYAKEVQKENKASYRNHSQLFKQPNHNKNHQRVHQPETGKHRRHI